MTNYKEEDITNARYWDYKYKEEGIERHDEDYTFSSTEEKTKKGIGYYIDIIIILAFLVIGIFGVIFIIKYGMPVGEDSFNILGLKNVTEMTSNTINNITEMTTNSIKETFNIQSKATVEHSINVGFPSYYLDKIDQYDNKVQKITSRRISYKSSFGKKNIENMEVDKKENKEDLKEIRRIFSGNNSEENENYTYKSENNENNTEENENYTYNSENNENNTEENNENNTEENENYAKKKYTPVQCIKENSVTVAGSSFIALSSSLYTVLISM